MSIYLIGTLDTKGLEVAFLRDRLAELGVATVVVDAGCLGEPGIAADVTRAEVFRAAGTSLADVVARGDRGHAVTTAAEGARHIVAQAQAERHRRRLSGVLLAAELRVGALAVPLGCRHVSQPPDRLTQPQQGLCRRGLLDCGLERRPRRGPLSPLQRSPAGDKRGLGVMRHGIIIGPDAGR